ncbi:AraC family transcriptional regulator [Pseudomonas sp. BGr12]|uniref:AraC-like transcriptional regulator QhpR n=1 Tax=Pseudomonas sp. BGr12 TaxID=2936269 RepID=UPI00255A0432|nr:AraC family transcriptional regulator [Pseudomonas sp. BJa5]MDL2428475.1 AraC family transcriptional regulator [Pseudomonas sp. BJa5]
MTMQLPQSNLASVGVLASAAYGFIDFIDAQGGDSDSVLGTVGLDAESLVDPTTKLPLGPFCRAFEEAARQTQNDNFGLEFGQQFEPGNLGILGYIALSSATLGDALRNMARVFSGHQQGSLLRLVEEGSSCRLEYQILHGSVSHKRQDADSSMAVYTNLIRHALGSRWAPQQVLFEHTRPEAWHKHCQTFDAPVLFGQPRNALVFCRSDLDRAMPNRDARLLDLLLATIQHSLPVGQSSMQDDVIECVRREIQLGLDSYDLCLERIAKRMNVPSWTLQRRLSEQGATFTDLVSEVRWRIACDKLAQSRLPISELAIQLGFSEVSAFSRAFKRSLGMSPREWRKNQGGLDS